MMDILEAVARAICGVNQDKPWGGGKMWEIHKQAAREAIAAYEKALGDRGLHITKRGF